MVDIRVDELEDVDVFLRLKRREPGGGTSPIILTSVSEIAVIVKNKKADADANKKFQYLKTLNDIIVTLDGSAVGAEYSEIQVKTKGVDQTPPGNYYYKLNVTRSSRTETIDTGVWHIENT